MRNITTTQAPTTTPHDATTFGRWMRGQRRRCNLTQWTLARQIGVCQAIVSHWERGRKLPGAAVAVRLALALDMPPATVCRHITEAKRLRRAWRIARRGYH